MSQHFYEFNVAIGTMYYPVPMLEKAQRLNKDLFVFVFSDAVFSVQDSKEKLDEIDLALRFKGFVPDAMNAQMVERVGAAEDR